MKFDVFSLQGAFSYSQLASANAIAGGATTSAVAAEVASGAAIEEQSAAYAMADSLPDADDWPAIEVVDEGLEFDTESSELYSPFAAKDPVAKAVGYGQPIYVSGLHRTPEEIAGSVTGAGFKIEAGKLVEAVRDAGRIASLKVDELFGSAGSIATQMQESAWNFLRGKTSEGRAEFAKNAALAAAASLALIGCSSAGGGNSELASVVLKAIFSDVMGGLGIFMLGLKLMNDGLDYVSNDSLKKVLKKLTSNRVAALAIGTGVTAIIQSSSVTSVMSLSLVDAGMMTLRQAMAVNIGANIGTTFTGILFALKIAKYGLSIIGAGMIPFLFLNRNESVENVGKAIFGLGAVFLGLVTMAHGFDHPVVHGAIKDFFSSMSGDSYAGIAACIAVAALATRIVQSSSATLGVIITLAKSGIIPFETAAALIMGANIGTTVTAGLAAIRGGTSLEARRVAVGHLLFNVMGALLLYPVSPHVIHAAKLLFESFGLTEAGGQAAGFHTAFNVAGAIPATIALKQFEALVRRVLPDSLAKEDPLVKHLHKGLLEQSPAIGLEASRQEIIGMGQHVMAMFEDLGKMLEMKGEKGDKGKFIKGVEDDLDKIQAAIFEWLDQVATKEMRRSDAEMIGSQRRMADEYESISDSLRDILKRLLKIRGREVELEGEARADLINIHSEVGSYVERVNAAVTANGGSQMVEAQRERKRILKIIKKARERHNNSVQASPVEAKISSFYLDILRSYGDIIERSINIADALAGGK